MADASGAVQALPQHDQVLDVLRCSSCFEPSTDTVVVCGKGHTSCRTCANRLVRSPSVKSVCPECRGGLLRAADGSWVPARAANGVVQECTVRCPYAGCAHTCTVGAMEEHKGQCEHAIVCCGRSRALGCPWRGKRSAEPAHTRSDHGDLLVDVFARHKEATDAKLRELSERLKDAAEETSERNDALQRDLSDVKTLVRANNASIKRLSDVDMQPWQRSTLEVVTALKADVAELKAHTKRKRTGDSERTERRDQKALREEQESTRRLTIELQRAREAHERTMAQLEAVTKERDALEEAEAEAAAMTITSCYS